MLTNLSLGVRVIKKVEVVAKTAIKKKAASPTTTKTIAPTMPSKRPHLETETVGDAPQPKKRVKQLAKKREREIFVIFNQTTRAIALGVHSPPIVESSAAAQLEPMVEPAVDPVVKQPTRAEASQTFATPEEMAHTTEKTHLSNPKKVATVVMEEEV